MKNLMNSLASLAFTFMMAMAVISCDPCNKVECTNGTCANGSCVCEPGYEKNAGSCVGVNMGYVGDGMISATVLTVDSLGNSMQTTNVGYTMEYSSSSPYTFTIKSFLSIANNDVTFTISSNNFDFITNTTVNTGASKTYTLSGTKTGSQVQLMITDVVTQTDYTLTYTE